MQELIDSVRKVGELQSKLAELRKSIFELQNAMEEHGDKASIEAVHVYVGLVLAMQAIAKHMFNGFKMGGDVISALRKDKDAQNNII